MEKGNNHLETWLGTSAVIQLGNCETKKASPSPEIQYLGDDRLNVLLILECWEQFDWLNHDDNGDYNGSDNGDKLDDDNDDGGEGDVESHRGCREACKTRLGENNGACVGICISICICDQY